MWNETTAVIAGNEHPYDQERLRDAGDTETTHWEIGTVGTVFRLSRPAELLGVGRVARHTTPRHATDAYATSAETSGSALAYNNFTSPPTYTTRGSEGKVLSLAVLKLANES